MPVPRLALLWRSALGAAIALAVGLGCTILSAMVSVAPATDMSEDSAPAMTVVATVPENVASQSSAMANMCPNACVGGTTSVACTGAELVVTSVLVVLLASRRNTYLRLLARVRRAGLARRRLRGRTPWVVPSPVSLCVFRV